jgi:large subunit ribosomal protein L25
MDIMLSAEARGAKERVLEDFIPAVLYGRGIASISLKLKRAEIEKVIHQAGESNLISVLYQGNTIQVLIKEYQRHSLSGKLLHIDLFQVNMKDKVKTEIPLHFIGESKAVKELSGSLIKDLDAIEVECLPGDLVDHIDVDISVLNEYHDEISVKDLVLPKGLELADDIDRVIVTVMPPRVQEVVEVVAAVTTEAPKEEVKK